MSKSMITRREFLKYSTAGSLAGLGSLAAPGILTSARAAKPIRIGCPMPLTGRYSREALYCVEGYKLWAKHINEKGYSYGNEGLPHREPGLIDGRKVELTILDDTSDPTQGARLMLHLIHNQKIDLLLGPYASSINLAVRPIIAAAKIPTVSATASSQKIWLGQKLNWQVQLMVPSRDRFAGMEVMCKNAGMKKVALLHIDDAMPIAAAEGVRKRILAAGLDLVLDEAYPIGIQDMVPLVRKARDAGAEVALRRRLLGRLHPDCQGRPFVEMGAQGDLVHVRSRPRGFQSGAREERGLALQRHRMAPDGQLARQQEVRRRL